VDQQPVGVGQYNRSNQATSRVGLFSNRHAALQAPQARHVQQFFDSGRATSSRWRRYTSARRNCCGHERREARGQTLSGQPIIRARYTIQQPPQLARAELSGFPGHATIARRLSSTSASADRDEYARPERQRRRATPVKHGRRQPGGAAVFASNATAHVRPLRLRTRSSRLGFNLKLSRG